MKNKKTKIWVILALLLAAGCVGGWLYFKNSPKEVTNFAPEFEEEQTRESSEGSVTGGITIPGYSEIVVDAGTTEVSVDLNNPEENHVYFQIDFYLPETDETIYTSKLLKPGQHLYDITLNRPLEEGEYDLIIRYGTFSADEALTPRNGAEVNCKLKAR